MNSSSVVSATAQVGRAEQRTYTLRFAFLFIFAALVPLSAQQEHQSASDVLQHALHLADLYNWADAGPEFSKAEEMFVAAGDQRNGLYAKLGRIRSNLEREPRTLAESSDQLAEELDTNPLLQTDKELRMFCLIVKGDIDTEIDTQAMGQDWEQVQALARELGDSKWQNRALAQLGLAAFYKGDIETARKNVGTALLAATKAGDKGAQIRYLTMIGFGLVASNMFEQAVLYFEQALKIADATPDAGYQFVTQEARLSALTGLGKFDAAQHLANDILTHAQQQHQISHQVAALDIVARIAQDHNDKQAALSALEQSIALSESAGLIRALSDAQSVIADIYRKSGELTKAEEFAAKAAASTQSSGNSWEVPQRLQALAELQISRGKYADADQVYDRADAFIDAMIGNVSSVQEKTALITASSEIYSQHFSLVAERFNDPVKAYSIIEQVRGRITTDLLMAGSVTSGEAKKADRAISRLRLNLMAARSTDEVRRIRDQIFMAEQSRYVTPEVSILKAQSHETIGIERVRHSLSPSEAVLEYVVAEPRSYCLAISSSGSRIVPLAGRQQIETLVAAYLKSVKAKQPGRAEARRLYDAVLGPIHEAVRKENLVVIRDGQLHLVPFDALVDASDHYVVETHTVIYAPSATSFYLLATQQRHPRTFPRALLAVGGIPYSPADLKQVSLTRGYDANALSDLPASKDEVLAAEAAVHDRTSTLLLGSSATEGAFKNADLAQYRIIHLAVHGFADTKYPERAALVLLKDPSAGEDGFLQSSEIVQLRLNADLVILSACDTAVGPLQGQEGIATLSRAFLLAGAKTVVSTLWSIDDTFSLFLMKQFYTHLATHEPAAHALTASKRDMLRKYGSEAVPYYWAGFVFEGVADRAVPSHDETQRANYVTHSK